MDTENVWYEFEQNNKMAKWITNVVGWGQQHCYLFIYLDILNERDYFVQDVKYAWRYSLSVHATYQSIFILFKHHMTNTVRTDLSGRVISLTNIVFSTQLSVKMDLLA